MAVQAAGRISIFLSAGPVPLGLTACARLGIDDTHQTDRTDRTDGDMTMGTSEGHGGLIRCVRCSFYGSREMGMVVDGVA